MQSMNHLLSVITLNSVLSVITNNLIETQEEGSNWLYSCTAVLCLLDQGDQHIQFLEDLSSVYAVSVA